MNDTIQVTGSGRSAVPRARRVCHWWVGYLLASPVRRLLESPERLLAPLVRPGMTVLEVGPGMGFFTLPLAGMIGPEGRVVCVDVQPRMIEGLRRRARRAGVLGRVETMVCGPDDLGIGRWAGAIDLALAIHVLHELRDATAFLAQVFDALRPGAALLIREPKGHVTQAEFDVTIAAAERAGFLRTPARVPVPPGLEAVLRRPGAADR